MTWVLIALFGRLPIGWLQLSHNRGRLLAAIAGVAFANLLVFVQLGIMGALNATTIAPYQLFRADIILASADSNTLTDGSNIARQRMFQAFAVPGVVDGLALYLANLEWQRADGSSSTLQTFGVDSDAKAFLAPHIAQNFDELILEDTVLIDKLARGVPEGELDAISSSDPYVFEVSNRTLRAVATLEIGGGFNADGTLVASDQTFLRLFGSRSAAAPNRILLKVADGVDPAIVVARLQSVFSPDIVTVSTYEDAAAADLRYQTIERPTGIIFGFGVLMGVLVGIVIVYQILSSDVSDHLREYATFKAMGYGQPFFLGIVFEEAIVLALFGFVPGIVVSLGLYEVLSGATGLPVAMDFARAVSVFLGTLLACALSGMIATRRLAGADPADLF